MFPQSRLCRFTTNLFVIEIVRDARVKGLGEDLSNIVRITEERSYLGQLLTVPLMHDQQWIGPMIQTVEVDT